MKLLGLKNRLKVRVTVLLLLYCFITVFAVSEYPMLNLISILFVLILAEMAVFLYTPIYVKNFIKSWRFKKKTEIPLPLEAQDIAKRIGLRKVHLKIADGMFNAYSYSNTICIGSNLLISYDKKQLEAVFAHEMWHIRGNHQFLKAISLVMVVFLITHIFALPDILTLLALFSYVTLIHIPINWYFEKRADAEAAKYVSRDGMISALLSLDAPENYGRASETHPSIKTRIGWLETNLTVE